ncbi:MAG: hypothetical protein K2X59_00180 [Sphingomonas sp.]|nr:hypothetical protein [Sphingomonas sp.]
MALHYDDDNYKAVIFAEDSFRAEHIWEAFETFERSMVAIFLTSSIAVADRIVRIMPIQAMGRRS